MIAEDGQVTPLNDDRITALVNDVIKPMANRGLRTLCLAYKDYVKGIWTISYFTEYRRFSGFTRSSLARQRIE